ncbi:hypothetical protein [Terracoccus sp. 273MFTsu3.1]|uniref:hypothetical protein n=1 Tax=Terracoccus sp. 273MFTsu3.1 TaxID=1172188 RepID=UPI00037FA214|nr:hypothetical protein [Terracoccus sp. 273MFTsu3.1]
MPANEWGAQPYIPTNTTSVPNRLDFRRGRFSIDFETNQINGALRGWQTVNGDFVDYYRFSREDSQMDDVYDEGTGGGKVYVGPIDLPCLHVLHTQGGREQQDGGLYYNDGLHVTLSVDSLDKVGLTRTDVESQRYLLDRLVYDGKVFKVIKVDVLGQIQRRDLVFTIDADQVRPDELVGDKQFERFSA